MFSCSSLTWRLSEHERSVYQTKAQAKKNDIQHNDTQHNDIQHNDTQHDDTQHSKENLELSKTVKTQDSA